MASSSEASCISDPNFATICAFLERFAKSCDITYPAFVDLQEMLENVEQVPQELIDLHIKLLRKARKTVFIEKWERALIKFCHSYSSQDGWEIERFGYKKSRLEVKLRVLKMLLEGQFDLNNKFKTSINTLEAGELRSKPLGKDKLGRIYWLQFDPSSNIRVYREDLDEESWTLVAKDRASLVELLQDLSGDEFPLDLNSLNEDSTSLEVDKPTLDTGQNSNSSFRNEDENSTEENSENKTLVTEEQEPVKIEASVNGGDHSEKQESNSCKSMENSESEKPSSMAQVDDDQHVEKKIKLDLATDDKELNHEDVIVGEAIEEPVMHIVGEGAGEDCETGNPDKEEKPQEDCDNFSRGKNSQADQVEGSTHNSTELDPSTPINAEKLKPTPKLWSIDTICGVNSSKDTSVEINNLEKQECVDIKTKHKNFSSFSIDSVLEKKDSSSPLPDSFSKFTVSCTDESTSENVNSKAPENILSELNTSFPKAVKNDEFQTVVETPKVLLSSENSFETTESTTNGKESIVSSEICEKVSEKTITINDSNESDKIVENEEGNNKKSDVTVMDNKLIKNQELSKIEMKGDEIKIIDESVQNDLSECSGIVEEKVEIINNDEIENSNPVDKNNPTIKNSEESSASDTTADDKMTLDNTVKDSDCDQKSNSVTGESKVLHEKLEERRGPKLDDGNQVLETSNCLSESQDHIGQKLSCEPIVTDICVPSNQKETNMEVADVSHTEVKIHSTLTREDSETVKSGNFSESVSRESPLNSENISKVSQRIDDTNDISETFTPIQKGIEILKEVPISNETEKTEVDKSEEILKTNVLEDRKDNKAEDIHKISGSEETEADPPKTTFEVSTKEKEAGKSEICSEISAAEEIKPDEPITLKVNIIEEKEADKPGVYPGISATKKLEAEKPKNTSEVTITEEKGAGKPDVYPGTPGTEALETDKPEQTLEVTTEEKEAGKSEICLETSAAKEIKANAPKDTLKVTTTEKPVVTTPEEKETEKPGVYPKTPASEEVEANKPKSTSHVTTEMKEVEKLEDSTETSATEEIKTGEPEGTSQVTTTEEKEADKPKICPETSNSENVEAYKPEVTIAKEKEAGKSKICPEISTTEEIKVDTSKDALEVITTEEKETKKSDVYPKTPVSEEIETEKPKIISHATTTEKKEVGKAEDHTETLSTELMEVDEPEDIPETIDTCEEPNDKSLPIEPEVEKNNSEVLEKDEKEENAEIEETKEETSSGKKEKPDTQKTTRNKKDSEEKKLETNEKEVGEKEEKEEEEEEKEPITEAPTTPPPNAEESDESKTEKGKRGRRRKKDIPPQRVLSRNRKGVEEEIVTEEIVLEKTRKRRGRRKTNEIEGGEISAADSNKKIQEEVKEVEKEKKEEVDENEEESNKAPESEEATNEDGEEKKIQKGRRWSRKSRRRRRRMAAKESSNSAGGEKEQTSKPKAEKGEKDEEGKEKKRGRKKEDGGTRTGGRQIPAREIKLLGISEVDTELPSIRQSRRIAQIKMKEEAERRRIEALQLESFKSKKSKKGSMSGKKRSKKNADSDSYDEKNDNEEDSEDEKLKSYKDGKKSRRKKKKDKLVFNESKPWQSSSGSSTADEEEDEIEEEPHEEEELLFKSDHEFSPESDVEDPEYKPIKRARTAKVDESERKDEVGKYDDTSCEKCGKNDHPEWILLCDKCDKGWHASCVRPALMVVPEGDWFCPPCEHAALIMKLRESLVQFDKLQKQRENEELRKKRLAFVGISLDNVLPSKKKSSKHEDEDHDGEKGEGSSSDSGSESDSESSGSESGSGDSSEPVYQLRERRSNVTSYRYNEYDELIKSALQDEIEAVKGAGNAGRGKDINNIVNAQRKSEKENEDEKDENSADEGKTADETNDKNGEDKKQTEKAKEKSKKDDDDDYDVDTEADGEEEEDENVVDEIPPVVPKHINKKKKSKSMKITSLDFTSEEEDNNSDSDFKGASSEEESDYSLPSDSESSDGNRRRRRGSDGPLRRSTRARVSRYDRDFINDDSEDDSPKRKKTRREWDSSESSDSDRSWGRRKRKSNKTYTRSARKSSKSKGKKKQKKRVIESGSEDFETPKRPKNKKIKYGGLDSPDEDKVLSRRTRGKKINYQEMNGSDSDDETTKRKSKPSRIIESDDDFVAEKEEDNQEAESEEVESGVDENEDGEESDKDSSSERKKPDEKKKKILDKIKKKKWVIPDPDDFSENDLLEDEQLDEFAEELEDLDEEEEEILGNILESGDVPINELKDAVKRAKEERRQKKENEMKEKIESKSQVDTIPKSFPPIPTHMEFPGKFPKIGRVKITPSRAELASQLAGMPQQPAGVASGKPMSFMQSGGGLIAPSKPLEEHNAVQLKETCPEVVKTSGGFLINPHQGDQSVGSLKEGHIPPKHSKDEPTVPTQRPFAPFQMETPPRGPLEMMGMMNSQPQPRGDGNNINPGMIPMSVNNNRPIPQFNAFQGIMNQPPRMHVYPSTIPVTVTGISDIDPQDQSRKKSVPKPGPKIKRKMDELSPQPESRGDSSDSGSAHMPITQGDELMQMKGIQDSPPKKKGRGRGKKQLLAEAQAQAQMQGKQDITVGAAQSPSQFPPQGLPPDGGSVISRMLNAPQGFPPGPRLRPPFRPSLPFPESPGSIPSMRMRVPVPGSPIFHTSHPHDPSPSGGGAINIPSTSGGVAKPAPPQGAPLIPRFPADPGARHQFPTQGSSPRPEFSSFPNFYGNFPPTGSSTLPASDDPNFHNPAFPEQFPEGQVPSGANPAKPFDEEAGGEFGGLASYFASQREDDLDT